MDELEKKLRDLKELLEKGMNNTGLGGAGSVKSGLVLPTLSKLPKAGHTSNAGQVKIPNVTPATKKSPVKSAEQTQNKDIKDLKMKEAQAQLAVKPMTKDEGSKDLYHIHENGVKITSTPMDLQEIQEKHGGVKKLESNGFRVVQHVPTEKISFKKNGQWEIEDMDKSGYKGYTPEDNARRKANNTSETTGIHTMDSIKQYGGNGPSAAAREAADMKAKSKKNPVKVFSPEEIAEMNSNMKKEESRPFYAYKPDKGVHAHLNDAKEHIKNKDIKNARTSLEWAKQAAGKSPESDTDRTRTLTNVTEKTEGRTTAVPGVSDMGVEVRRSNPANKEYSKVVSPKQHADTAKQIANNNIKQTKEIKPKLPK